MSFDREGFGAAGFTLVELLVVMSLLGLLAAVVPAFLPRASPRLELAAAARGLVTDLRAERSVARQGGRPTKLDIDLVAKAYTPSTVQAMRRLGETIRIELLSAAPRERFASGASIRFFPDGSSSGGKIALHREEHTAIVTVDWLTGRVFTE